MFPYIDTTDWPFTPFVALVALALAAGYAIASWRARRSGIDREQFAKLGLIVIGCAFVGGHIAKFFYVPGGLRVLWTRPTLLFQVLSGQASLGGMIGGFLGGVGFLWLSRIPYRAHYLYADAACFAIPFSWWMGRAGCYLVHDHPGIRTASLLGVRYPDGTRYDLGLLEVLFLLALAGIFWILDRKPRPLGFFYVAFLFAYGIFRLMLDRLHVDPPRYRGWTVDQIASCLLILTGILTILELRRLQNVIN